MKRSRCSLTSLGLILVLTMGLIPRATRAGGNEGEPPQLYAMMAAQPIGTIESSGEVVINGRTIYGKGTVWDGELLQAPAEASARVSLEAVGTVTLMNGAMVKLATAATLLGAEAKGPALVATVIGGEVTVNLRPEASAYLQIAGSAFTAPKGTSFRAAVRDGKAVVDGASGMVREIGGWAIRLPQPIIEAASRERVAAGELGHWAINLPPAIGEMAGSPARAETSFGRRQQLIHTLGLGISDGWNQAPPVRLHASASIGSIGTVESLNAMRINGRVVRGKELIWDGELLQAPADSGIRVALDAIGQVTLTGGSVARLATATTRLDDQTSRRVLVATLISGDVIVKLQPEAGAYVQAYGSGFAAANGASFRVGARDGLAVSETAHGVVQEMGRWAIELVASVRPVMDAAINAARAQARSTPPRYFVRPVGLSYNTSVRARSTRQVQVQVTDENDRRVPDLPIVFLLAGKGGQGLGTLSSGAAAGGESVTVNTDAQGIATATFNAGDVAGSVSITATVQGTTYSWTGLLTVAKFVPGFWTVQNALPVFATAAAGIAAGAATAVTKGSDREQPIKPVGGPIIKP